MSRDTDFAVKMPFRAVALLNILWCEILSKMGQAWIEGWFNRRQRMLSYRKPKIPLYCGCFHVVVAFITLHIFFFLNAFCMVKCKNVQS